MLTLGSPGCVHGPVGVIICDPGVAGQAPRHDGVMWLMLAAELQVPGSRDDPGASAGSGYVVEGTGGRFWALGLGSPAVTPSHSRLKAGRGLHPAPAQGLSAELHLGHGTFEVGLGLEVSQPTPLHQPPQDLPPACRNPCSWSGRGQESYS